MFKLFRYIRKKELPLVVLSLVLIVGQVWLDLRLPDYMSEITVLVQTPGSAMGDVWLAGGKMLLCALGSAALTVIVGYFAARVAAGLSFEIREALFGKVIDLGASEIDRFSTASLITRTTNDITQIQMVVAMGLQVMIKAPILAVWAVGKIISKNWSLSMVTAAAVVLLVTTIAVLMSVVIPRFKLVQKQTDSLNRVARENLSGMRVVRAFNAEDYQDEKFGEVNEDLMRTQLFNQRTMSVMNPMMMLIMSGMPLAIYWLGASLINAAGATQKLALFSDVVVFSSYATFVVMAFMMLTMIFMILPRAQVSAQRINEVLDTAVSVLPGKRTDAPQKGTVEFKNVSFHYPESSENVLENISFSAAPGETVAFIGSTGCGKTTLLNLITRFYDATEGTVLVDGVDVREYDFDALYRRVALAPQRAVLFSGTVAENVAFGECGREVTEPEILNALDIAQGSEFVAKMPGGAKAVLAQGGSNVSGGQKQRLSIARAVARRPEILLFDDSFSALDYKTDSLLRKRLATDLKGTTCLIVAQRIGTIRHADRIVVLDDGKAVGIGTHEELMKNCPVYQEIALSQLSEDELAQ